MFRVHKLKFSFISTSLFALLSLATVRSAEVCAKNDLPTVYLEAAMDMLKRAKDSYPTADSIAKMQKPQDCDDILDLGFNKSGVYRIWPSSRVIHRRSVEVYCDMVTDGGGWTLIQRRGNFQRAADYFYKDWESYKKGFGDLDKDFWLGNDNIFAISNQKQYSARFDLKDVEGTTAYAHYDFFWIDDEYHKYMLHIKDYRGDAGDSMYPKHDKMKFSTKDQCNDNKNSTECCAVSFKGAWWYNACHDSNLNALYLRGKHESHANGVNWKSWKGHKESLDTTEIKLRPKDSKSHKIHKDNTVTPE